jgi:hypothetical protein
MHWLILLAVVILQAHDMHSAHAMPAAPPAADPVSLFNHRLAGVLVILLGSFAYLENTALQKFRAVKYLWPMPLLVLGTYVFLYSDNPQLFPFDLQRWARHATAWEHKTISVMVIALGLIELFRRTGKLKHPAWKHILNAIMLTAGALLLFHRGKHHVDIIHTQHIWMGIVAVTLSVAKIISDWKGGSLAWLGRYAVPLLMVTLGMQLVLYVE